MDKNKIKQSDYLDILYEGKNKTYGGYELRRNYNKRLIVGSVVVLLLLGGAFGSTLIESKEIEEKDFVIDEPVQIKPIEELLPPDIPDAPPPPKQVTVPPPPKPTFKLDPPVIVENEKVRKEDKITDLEERPDQSVASSTLNDGPNTDPDGADPGLLTGTGPTGPPDPGPTEQPKPTGPERTVDKKAVPPIDVNAFFKKNVVYPQMMASENKSGTVTVQFVVRVNGTIDNIKIIKSPDPLFTKEAQRVMKILQGQGKWTPAEKNGKAVASYHTLPIRFQLK